MKTDLPICPENYEITDDGKVINKRTGRVLKHSKNPSGYHIVVISYQGKRKAFTVHRQVMLAFEFLPDNEKFEVNHIDGNKDNNCINNLEWMTQSDNQKHSIQVLGAKRYLEYKKVEAKLNEFSKIFNSAEDVARYFGTHLQSVYRVLRGRRKTLKGFKLSYID